MAILFIRTIIIYSLVVFSLRIMGKRQIGELQPSELVVAIMISDLATIPMTDVSVPLLYGIIPIFTLVICEIIISFLNLKSEKMRILLSGRPQLLIKDGRLQREEMLHSRVNIDDLMEELRKAGYFSLNDVDTAILETGGSLSVIPSVDASPVTNRDMGIDGIQEQIPYIYVSDGKIRHDELARGQKDGVWLDKIMRDYKVNVAKDIFILSEDGEGNIFLQRKDEK